MALRPLRRTQRYSLFSFSRPILYRMEAVDCDPRRPAYDNWQKEQWNSIVCQRPTTLQNSQCTTYSISYESASGDSMVW